MFFISAAILAFGSIFYCIFGSGKLQPWAKQSDVGPIEVDMEVNSLQEEGKEKEKSTHDIQYGIGKPVKFLQTDNSTEVDGYDSTV